MCSMPSNAVLSRCVVVVRKNVRSLTVQNKMRTAWLKPCSCCVKLVCCQILHCCCCVCGDDDATTKLSGPDSGSACPAGIIIRVAERSRRKNCAKHWRASSGVNESNSSTCPEVRSPTLSPIHFAMAIGCFGGADTCCGSTSERALSIAWCL